jgi:putative endonuclease
MKPPEGADQREELGAAGEDLAARHLGRQGYRVIERNYSFLDGEIDLIAMDGDVLAFVEVKTRSCDAFGPPELAVDYRKQRRIQRAAERFIVQKRLRRPIIRYDVVTVVIQGPDGEPDVKLFKNAF